MSEKRGVEWKADLDDVNLDVLIARCRALRSAMIRETIFRVARGLKHLPGKICARLRTSPEPAAPDGPVETGLTRK